MWTKDPFMDILSKLIQHRLTFSSSYLSHIKKRYLFSGKVVWDGEYGEEGTWTCTWHVKTQTRNESDFSTLDCYCFKSVHAECEPTLSAVSAWGRKREIRGIFFIPYFWFSFKIAMVIFFWTR